MAFLKRQDTSLDPFDVDANRRAPARSEATFAKKMRAAVATSFDNLTLPLATYFIIEPDRIHPDLNLSRVARWKLFSRMLLNTRRVWTGTTFRAQLMMAQSILELDPARPGVVVECGCFLGGTTVNLSLVCEAAGRELIAYDSFEGLPADEETDNHSTPEAAGFLVSDFERVKNFVAEFGAGDVVTFRKGWFRDTLPDHNEPVAMALLDVDFQSSLHDCVRYLWPKLMYGSRIYIDEYTIVDYCSLFYSEAWWDTYMPGTDPPGLVGAGSGVPLGGFYIGPRGRFSPTQRQHSLGYAFKGSTSLWAYEPPAD